MNNKGFTLVELLATIALIAVIMLLFMPTIGKLVSEFQNKDKVEMLQNSAIMAAKEYVTDGKANTSSISISCNTSTTATLNVLISDLQKDNYLDYDEFYDGDWIKINYDCDAKKFISYDYPKDTDTYNGIQRSVIKSIIKDAKEDLKNNPCNDLDTSKEEGDYTFYFTCSNGKRIYKYIEKTS